MSLNILFLSLLDFDNLDERNIYTDLLLEFKKNGHNLSIISPVERKNNKVTDLIKVEENCRILKLRIGNIQKTNLVEKGISTIRLENQYIRGIKKYFSDISFDLIIYSTPPVTFQKVVSFVKKRDKAKSYLLLKDIFPQNAIDLNKLRKVSAIYKYFRYKEKKLYLISDYIGTMSQGNSEYLLKKNSFLNDKFIEVNPNSIRVEEFNKDIDNKNIRRKLKILENDILILYGGNLGIPQGIDFLLEIADYIEKKEGITLAIVGSGTEYKKIQYYLISRRLKKTKLIEYLPRDTFYKLEASADIGLILLDKRFTIPNIPSRMLGYMQAQLPILAATDNNTDLKDILREGQYGLWSQHGDIGGFKNNLLILLDKDKRKTMGNNGYEYLRDNFDVSRSYEKIIRHFSEEDDNVRK